MYSSWQVTGQRADEPPDQTNCRSWISLKELPIGKGVTLLGAILKTLNLSLICDCTGFSYLPRFAVEVGKGGYVPIVKSPVFGRVDSFVEFHGWFNHWCCLYFLLQLRLLGKHQFFIIINFMNYSVKLFDFWNQRMFSE